jgi:two-component system sensor kinase FixL
MLLVSAFLVMIITALTYLAITAKRRAKQLRQTANQMSTFFSNLSGIAYRCLNTPDWPMQFISDGCLQLTGFPADDFIQGRQSWRNLIHPDDRDTVWHTVQHALDKGELFELEYRIKTNTNGQRWVKERGQVVEPRNDLVVHLEGIISDITERKTADFALADTRSFSDAVVENAAEAVITIDERGNIETFNRAAQKMFGYSGNNAYGRNIRTLINGSDKIARSKQIEEYLTRSIEPPAEGLEVECLNADGAIFPVLISFSIVKNHGAKKFVALVRDLSLQRAAEDLAREQQDLLAHLDRLHMFGEMSTGIAHEVNQPITAISIYAQAGKRLLESNKQERLPEVFDNISKHAKRAGDVIERIQAMTRREKSALKIENCNALIRETAELAKAEARTKNITIELTLDDQLHNVLVDRVQIQQVILNLLRNGMESMLSIDCRHGNKIKLVTTLHGDESINIEVVDSGTGISASIQDSLFTPFTSTKITGLGMGLSISHAIVGNHDGHLTFTNNSICGATFCLTLPLANEGDVDE